MTCVLRQAGRKDIPQLWDVRYAVTENTLARGRISDEDVRREIEDSGRGWVVDCEGTIEAFAICNAQSGNIWALFVHPRAQGMGYGSLLHDEMLAWLRTCQVPLLWLTTGDATRARGFYERRGWRHAGVCASGEARYERNNSV